MKQRLDNAYQVVYYHNGDRLVYWPADTNSDRLRDKLIQARAEGHTAILAQVSLRRSRDA